jgi:hypothetical protein
LIERGSIITSNAVRSRQCDPARTVNQALQPAELTGVLSTVRHFG